jgi:hypothetical protein
MREGRVEPILHAYPVCSTRRRAEDSIASMPITIQASHAEQRGAALEVLVPREDARRN